MKKITTILMSLILTVAVGQANAKEAAKKAAARGKRGQELIEAINREVPISPQQAQKLEEAQHHLKELSLEMESGQEMSALSL